MTMIQILIDGRSLQTSDDSGDMSQVKLRQDSVLPVTLAYHRSSCSECNSCQDGTSAALPRVELSRGYSGVCRPFMSMLHGMKEQEL